MTTLAHDLEFPSTAESWSRFGLALARLTVFGLLYGGAWLFAAWLHVDRLWARPAPALSHFAIWCVLVLVGCRLVRRAARAGSPPTAVVSVLVIVALYLTSLPLVAWLVP